MWCRCGVDVVKPGIAISVLITVSVSSICVWNVCVDVVKPGIAISVGECVDISYPMKHPDPSQPTKTISHLSSKTQR